MWPPFPYFQKIPDTNIEKRCHIDKLHTLFFYIDDITRDIKSLLIQKLCTCEYDQFEQHLSEQFSIQEQKTN